MADTVTADKVSDAAPNPANAPGAVVSTTPHRGVLAAQRARAGRGETMRLIEAGKMDDAAAKPSVPAPGRAAPPAADPPAADAAPPPVADGADDAADDETGKPDPTAPPAAAAKPDAPDAETGKRLAQIQAAEARSKAKIAAAAAAERTELDKRAKAIETEWAPRVAKAEAFEALRAKARKGSIHLVAAVKALGIDEDGFEAAAQALYSHSKAGAADPARKAQADRMLREHEDEERLDSTQRRIDELEAKLAQKDQAAEFDRLRGGYLDSAVKAIDASAAPIAAALAAKNPAKLRAALWEHTVALTEELDGDVPDFADVIARYETTRRAELEELGLAPPTAKTTDPKTNTQAADKKPPAKTLSADLSTPRVPRPTTSGREHRKETMRMLEQGQLE